MLVQRLAVKCRFLFFLYSVQMHILRANIGLRFRWVFMDSWQTPNILFTVYNYFTCWFLLYTHSTSNWRPEQTFPPYPQAPCGLNTTLQFLYHPHLSMWPLTPNSLWINQLQLSLDLVFPWQQHQWAQPHVSDCIMFPVATVRKHKLFLWNWLLSRLLLGHILMH